MRLCPRTGLLILALLAVSWLVPSVAGARNATDAAAVNDQLASADQSRQFAPADRPPTPEPQPPAETNVAAGKPFYEWERGTDGWFGLRPKLENRGIIFEASVTSDVFWDASGGHRPGRGGILELLNANLIVNTERLAGWKGGTFFLNFQQSAGDNGTDIVGDLQGFSNINSGQDLAQISELWYEQTLCSDKLRLKVGKVDANTEFARVANGTDFINSSFGYSPTLVGFPTFPNPATSINAFAYPADWLYFGAGLYDGSTLEGINTGSRGPATFLGSPGAVFVIGEAGVKWALAEKTLAGRLAGGIWNHSGHIERFDGGSESGTSGFYFTFDQQLWRKNPKDENDTRGIAVFAQYGWANPQISPFAHHIGGGFTWTGLLPGRDDDVFGLGASYVRLSGEAGFDRDYELVIEVFYKIQLLQWLSLKPDIQYTVNPGGSSDTQDALVVLLRLEADL